MKKYVLLGVIALVAMLISVVPAMAADTATISATGDIVQTLSIESSITTLAFPSFHEGYNTINPAGTLTVTSTFVPTWRVTASAEDGYGYMRLPAATEGGYKKPLTNPLEQYNYKAATPAWGNVHGMTFTGTGSTTMNEAFRQNIIVSDTPGSYSTNITYTIAAV